MLPTIDALRAVLKETIPTKQRQGCVTDGLADELADLPASYDAMLRFAERLDALPLREDWPYDEPDLDWDAVSMAMADDRPAEPIAVLDAEEHAARIEAGFLGSVCGCQLGKPVEIDPSLAELRVALDKHGDWPLRDYFRQEVVADLRKQHPSWMKTTREGLVAAAPDDDINYTILGMLVLEAHGLAFTHDHLREHWINHLPAGTTFGPERLAMANFAMHSYANACGAGVAPPFDRWVRLFNPRDELCGAAIRADAYGYAALGHPALAAELAWRDATLTHRRSGVYATMFIAAAIAAAPVVDDRLTAFEIALKYVPQRSRFFEYVSDGLARVRDADDWLDGYEKLREQYGRWTHCWSYFECGTLINTLRFAESVDHGFCLQVMQGNDTDSFGATSGSLLGCCFGPGHLDPRWLAPLNDTIHTTLAEFHEQSLTAVARRMGELARLTR